MYLPDTLVRQRRLGVSPYFLRLFEIFDQPASAQLGGQLGVSHTLRAAVAPPWIYADLDENSAHPVWHRPTSVSVPLSSQSAPTCFPPRIAESPPYDVGHGT